jgi:hypothetical protein
MPSSRAFITMLLRPAKSLISTLRALPTEAGIDVLVAGTTFCTALTCVPPLCEKAAEPTHGWRGLWRKLAISSTNCESSLSCGSDFGGTHAFFQFEGDVGNDAGQVAIAGAFAVTVDGALHVRRAGFKRRQRVGHAQADVVVRVDARFLPLSGRGPPR